MSKIIALSEAASIALHSIILIGRSEGNINVIQIAKEIGSSKHHVAKVLQRLVKDNFIVSQRGPNGGFVLKIPANKITLLQIYESIEGKIEILKCPLEHKVCPFDKCIMNNVTNKIAMTFREYLKNQTLDKYL